MLDQNCGPAVSSRVLPVRSCSLAPRHAPRPSSCWPAAAAGSPPLRLTAWPAPRLAGALARWGYPSPDPPFHLLLGFLITLLDRLLPVEAARAGHGANLGSVVHHAFQPNQALVVQHSQHIHEEMIQCLASLHPEVGKGVIVDGIVATEPTIDRMVFAASRQFAGAADSIAAGLQPEGDQNGRRERRLSGTPLKGFDVLFERSQVERGDEVHQRSCGVVLFDQSVEVENSKLNDVPIDRLASDGGRARGRGLSGFGRPLGARVVAQIEQHPFHGSKTFGLFYLLRAGSGFWPILSQLLPACALWRRRVGLRPAHRREAPTRHCRPPEESRLPSRASGPRSGALSPNAGIVYAPQAPPSPSAIIHRGRNLG